MTTDAALVAAVLSVLGAACGLVAVAALVQQRIRADREKEKQKGGFILDGGCAADSDEPSFLDPIIDLMRPGLIAIIFAALGVVFSVSAGVVSLYQ